jgi:nitrogen fixation protein FixH
LSVTDTAGAPVRLANIEATVGRATHVRDDQKPEFVFDGQNYVAPARLGDGNWNIRLVATAEDGTRFRQRVVVEVPRDKS